MKISFIFVALRTYVDLRERQFDIVGAVVLAEEAYSLLVEANDCAYPKVQEAAGISISFNAAERYAEVTYRNLRDQKNGIDQEDDEIANSSFNLSEAILREGLEDLLELLLGIELKYMALVMT